MSTNRQLLLPPIWQQGSALEGRIDALGTTRINIAALVARADKIEVVGGREDWMEFDGTSLDITEAPIFRKDTEFRVYFIASNDDGEQRAFYRLIVNGSRLATLHSGLFFKEAVNYDGDRVSVHGLPTLIREMTDNDYGTSSTATDIDVDMSDSSGNATPIDYVFLKYKGNLTNYRFTPTGGPSESFTRTVPEEIDTYGGGKTDLEVNGFKHDLYPLPNRVSATSVRMQFSGTGVEIYALMFLELGIEIDAAILDMTFDKVDRVGQSRQLPGGSNRVNIMGAGRWKWEYQLSVLFRRAAAKKLYYWMERNPNFVFVPEFSLHPSRVFPAFWGSLEVRGRYLTRVKGSGDRIEFAVSEQ